MNTRITNQSYPSLNRDLDTIHEFRVSFSFSRKSLDNITIDGFTILDSDNIDVSDKLNVVDYDKLMIELEDHVGCEDVWTREDQQEVDWSTNPDY